ncbi:MAG: hypothetical protein J6R88_03165 [Clostridia bacterium]|nr:hypothetical protein [Clostridia bacterium]
MFNLLGIFVENVAENIQKSLTIMWQGVLAIFIVIGVIIAITYVLNKITAPKKTNTTTDDDEE